MLKQLHLKHTNENKLFVVSDTHFCHDKSFLYTKRGFKSIEEHDNILIERWNNIVRPQDQVLHLGDFIFKSDYEKCMSYLRRLNGSILMLFGNHNSGIHQVYTTAKRGQGYSDDIEVYPLTYFNVTFLGRYIYGWINKTPFVAQHFAPRIWDYMQRQAISLTGHSHGSDKESNPDWPYHKRLDCGIENFGRPISFDEIMEIMNKKETIPLDGHH